MTEQENQKKSFKDTLNLPHTDFPIRANYKEEDPVMLGRWAEENLYVRSFDCNKGQEKFILHDGPPYANGHTHIGHAYNKVLKDIVCKSQRMLGKHVPVTPGWDCHGLPIEFAVKKENPTLTGAELKKACREYAEKWINIQRHEFKQLGVLMNWDNPYKTMDFNYEASILEAFGKFVECGYIERKNKSVPWCPSCNTVLAAAEIEYNDRKDPSVYFLFKSTDAIKHKIAPQLQNKDISFLVWTTTPWTIPLNRAVLLKPATEYIIAEVNERYVVMGKDCLNNVINTTGFTITPIAEFNSAILDNKYSVFHPLIDNYEVPVILDDSVSLADGTACVHNAPGCGPIDYEVGVKNNLEIYSPISGDGRYTADIKPKELAGMPFTDGQGWVITQLTERNALFFKTSIKHSYPHCWRCRGGLIWRATKQWFCDLSHNDLKDKALEAIPALTMIPETSHNRFAATLEGRLEWCLSRQREWGVPIPALICTTCDHAHTNKEFILEVAKKIAQEGIEYWDTVSLESLVSPNMKCMNCSGVLFEKETDILDVWFESGVSHYAVLKKNANLAYPADMYLEGKDQHRAWFQSSLLTSLIVEEKPCFKTIVTHGFTVDERGRKMSKSLGNVVSPQQMIEKLGTDGLRLWASSIDNSGDAVVSEVLLKNVQEVFRKIRNTCRFLLSNINDFDITKDAIPVEKMKMIDKYALQELHEIYEEIIRSYEEYNFTRVFHLLGTYCSVNLSAFYLDIIKDRLYVEKNDGFERRSAQTVCATILDALVKLMAPIMSFTAEQLSDHYQKDKTESIHLQKFPELTQIWQQLSHRSRISETVPGYTSVGEETARKVEEIASLHKNEERWEILKSMRSSLLKEIEIQREKQVVKHSLEAHVTMFVDPAAPYAQTVQKLFMDINENGETVENFFKEFLIVSQVTIAYAPDGLHATELKGLMAHVDHAVGVKCPRCWQWNVTQDCDGLCDRCRKIVG